MDEAPKEKSGDSKARLQAVAAELFAEKGYDAVSIRQIARNAGLNISLVSYYFGGKEGLYRAVVENTFAPVLELFKQERETGGTVEERLRTFAHSLATLHRSHPGPLRLLQRELAAPSFYFGTLVGETAPAILSRISRLFAQGIEAGEFRRDVTPVNATMAFLGMLNFYFVVRPMRELVVGGGEELDRQFIDDALRVFFRGVGAEGRG